MKKRSNFVLRDTDQHRFDGFSFARGRRGRVATHLDNLPDDQTAHGKRKTAEARDPCPQHDNRQMLFPILR